MNRTNWIIVSVALTTAVAVFSQRTAVGEDSAAPQSRHANARKRDVQ